MKKALIFYPHNPANPMHGSHLRAVQQLNELNGCDLFYASTRRTSDTRWPIGKKQVKKILGLKEIYLYEGSRYGLLNIAVMLPLKIIMKCLSLLGFSQDLPEIFRVFEQKMMTCWFSSVARKCEADLVVINYTYWDYLISGCDRSLLFAMELHDMLPVNKYLSHRIIQNFKYEQKNVSLREDYEKISYVEKKEELPTIVQEELINNVRRLREYHIVWSISDRETDILRSMNRDIAVDTIYPSLPGKRVEENPDSYALLPIGPNPFNTYAVLRFIREVVPFIDSVGNGKILVSGKHWSNREIQYPSLMKYIGLVDDFERVLAFSRFVIVPAAVGTGQQIKIFEALSSGVPVICYRNAVPEFMRTTDLGVICVDNSTEFAEFINLLMQDEPFCLAVKKGALNFRSRKEKQFSYQDSLAKLTKNRSNSLLGVG